MANLALAFTLRVANRIAGRTTRSSTVGRMRRRAIVVDDQPSNLALLEELLEPFDFDLQTASGGEAAIALVAERMPDIMMLDLVMPGLDGLEVLKRLRAENARRFPIVMVTAYTDRDLRLRALEAGADEFLEKPIDEAILRARIRTLLALEDARVALEARNAALEASQNEQRELTQFLAHDLRNQLSIASVSLLAFEKAATTPERREALEIGAGAIERMSELTSDLLMVGRLEEATMPIELRPVQLAAAIERIARRYGPRASANGIRLRASADGTAIADPGILQRVLENLVDNALRHTPRSGEISLEGAMSPSGAARLIVANTGPPIEVEQRERVFRKFARGSGPAARPGSLGLGLYFCRRAIEAQGGRIWIDDATRWPTAFVIELPGVA